MEEELVEQALYSPFARDAKHLLGELWWLIAILVLVALSRETLRSLVTSIMVLRSGDYKIDSSVLLDGVPARIVRKGIWKTVFYVYYKSSTPTNGPAVFFTKRVVMNEELPNLRIETPQERMDLLIPEEFITTDTS